MNAGTVVTLVVGLFWGGACGICAEPWFVLGTLGSDGRRSPVVGLQAEPPADFNPPWEGGFSVPYPTYTIRVEADGRQHTIRWGAIRIPNAEAQRLSDFVRAAYARFGQEPTVRALPPAGPCL